MSDDRRDRIPGVRRAMEVPPSRHRVRRSVEDELRFHLEGRIEELIAAGMSRAEAEAEVRRRFGDEQRIREQCESIDLATHRRRSLGESLHETWRDARYAVRTLVRQPGFALVVILTLALGIGANTAIFSAVNAVLLRPIHTPWLDRLVVVRHDLAALNLFGAELSVPETIDLTKRTEVFETGGGYRTVDYTLTGAGEPRRVTGTITVGDFFGTLGMQPLHGRFPGAADAQPGSDRVVVLSHGMWQESFGSDRSVIGRTIELNGTAFEIVGIARPDQHFPRAAQFWTPQILTPVVMERRGTLNTVAVLKLREGVGEAAVRNVLTDEYAIWTRATPQQMRGDESNANYIFAKPLVDDLAGELRPILLALMAAVLLVLLIACANVGSLQLVRATGRARELAVRVALGAGRWPIIRQRLVESLVLAIAGGLAGLALGAVAISVLRRLDIGSFEALRQVRLDAPVLLFTTTVVIASGIIFGLAPAMRAARVDPQDALKETPRGSTGGASRQRFLQGAVVVQLALALVLLLGAGLAVRSLARLLDTTLGFDPEHVLTMQIAPGSRYAETAARDAFRVELLERLRNAPGVEAAGIIGGLPFTDGGTSSPFNIRGAEPLPDGKQRHANMYWVGGDYFEAMDIPLIAGRLFDERDVPGAEGVFVIDEQLAKEYFPGQDPIGRMINHGPDGRIIGVVASVKKTSLGEPYKAAVYHPFAQNPWALGMMSVVVRGRGTPESLVNTARSVIRDIDPNLPVYDIQPMTARVERSVGARRFAMMVLGGFAALALTLAGLGIYGVISYGTSQRQQEIGIRMALGARPRDVIGMVLKGGAVLAGVGLAFGALLFLGVERLLVSLLYGLSPRDPLTLAVSVTILGAIALVACLIPAWRAARLDPTVALRAQ